MLLQNSNVHFELSPTLVDHLLIPAQLLSDQRFPDVSRNRETNSLHCTQPEINLPRNWQPKPTVCAVETDDFACRFVCID